MTPGEANALLGLWGPVAIALAFAIANWIAVWAGGRPGLAVERLTKPAVMVWLIAAALLGHAWTPEAAAVRPLLIAGLIASLAGDVLLLPPSRLVAGLGAFLAAHLAYLALFLGLGPDPAWLAAGLAGAVVLVATVGRWLVRLAGRTGFARPVAAYLLAIAAMAVAATGTGNPVLAAGAWLFVASDSLLGWARFGADGAVGGRRGGGRALGVAVMVTYHAAQVLVVLGVLGGFAQAVAA